MAKKSINRGFPTVSTFNKPIDLTPGSEMLVMYQTGINITNAPKMSNQISVNQEIKEDDIRQTPMIERGKNRSIGIQPTNDEDFILLGASLSKGIIAAGTKGIVKKSIEKGGMKNIIPTYSELAAMKIQGFQAHHILPQYLGKMLGYTKKEMLNHPATLISQYAHTGKLNVNAFHKAISKYIPYEKGVKYTADEIYMGLQKAYNDLKRPDLFNVIKDYIK